MRKCEVANNDSHKYGRDALNASEFQHCIFIAFNIKHKKNKNIMDFGKIFVFLRRCCINSRQQ